MKKKHVLAMTLLLTAISISTQAKAADRVVVNTGEIQTFTTNFDAVSSTSSGGAILNKGTASVTGNSFTKNHSDSWGGAIYTTGGTLTVDGVDFTENTAYAAGAIGAGTANLDLIIKNSTFTSNEADTMGAVGLFSKGSIENSKFVGNKATLAEEDGAGALFLGSLSEMVITDSTFDSNSSASRGGAIATRDIGQGNNVEGKLDIVNTTFTNNTAVGDGGAIYNAFYNSESEPDNVSIKNSTFDGNSTQANGGAIYNAAKDLGGNTSSVSITDTNFTNNSAAANGGAIYSYGDVNITASESDVVFSGNSAADGNDIYIASADADLNLNIGSGKSVSIDGGISGVSNYNINVAGDGTFDVKAGLKNANINVNSGMLWLGEGSSINGAGNHINLASGSTLNTINNAVDTFDANLISANGQVTLKVDVNVETGIGDGIGDALATPASTFALRRNSSGQSFIIDEINPLGNVTEDSVSVNLYEALGLSSENATLDTSNTEANDIMTPIRRLTGTVSSDGIATYGVAGNSYNDFNSAIMVAPVAAQVGGYLNQLQSYDEAFMNMDMYMLMTKEQRLAKKYANKYAVNEASLGYQEPYAAYAQKSGFFRPYGSFESVRLDNGPKVSNVAWGTYAGLESELYELGNDWDAMFSVYAGYNGSHQAFQGNSIYQNGGTLGATGVAYKGNFFTGLTANIGSNVADADTKYGSEDFAMLMTGVASKTGYNFEMAEGKFIIQPSLLMAYTMVNTFDYTNAAGVNINTDSLHAFTFEPGVKFIGNLKNGWQPYAGVSVVMNAMDDADFKANDTALPKLTVKPYAKYGVGVKKSWGERFTGFLQAFVTSGGRDGVGFQGGFKWQLGKKVEKVQGPSEKKYIKAGSKSRTIS